MIRAHAVDAVRAAEAAAMSALPEGELMQRAAGGLAEVAAARLEDRDGRSVVALVGGGNNGGDTLYAAGLLSDAGFACVAVLVADSGRDGVHAEALAAAESAGVAVLLAAPDREPDVAGSRPDREPEVGVPSPVREPDAGGSAPDREHIFGGVEDVLAVVAGADLVLDGIVGIGGRPGLRPEATRLVDAIDDDAWVIAVDLASGLDPAGEVSDDDAVWADETVTFGTPKPAHLLPAGEAASGRLTVVDIGLDVDDVPAAVERLTHDDVAQLWPVPGPTDDKYSRGVLGVVAGGEAYSGAAVLCVTAAVEAGAGMVRYVGTPTPTGLVRAAVPEAVHGEGQVQAWLVGPGLDIEATGDGAEEQLRVARAALASDLPVVVDAGGLDLVVGRREAPTLLTPHAGELARLVSRLGADGVEVTREQVEGDPLGHARKVAELTGATVLLKGATTLVVGPDPSQAVRSQADAPAWLATAGAGDVLSGVVGTLLAAGLAPIDAGSLGALVHGVAADQANGGGPIRALAVAHAVPHAVRRLLARPRS